MGDDDYTRALLNLGSARAYPGLERLICAALADPDTAAELLTNPATTVERLASVVQLSAAERDLAVSIIGAADIHDFAARLHARVQQE